MKFAVLILVVAAVLSPRAVTGNPLPGTPISSLAAADAVPLDASRSLRGGTPSSRDGPIDPTPFRTKPNDCSSGSSFVPQCYAVSEGIIGDEDTCSNYWCYQCSSCASPDKSQCLSTSYCTGLLNAIQIIATDQADIPWKVGCCVYM